MKHPSSRRLFDYWNNRRGNRVAPERGDIEPGAIGGILTDTFILSYQPRAGHPFRLAGTRLCALFCRELKGEPFDKPWSEPGRQAARELVDMVADESVGIVAGVRGQTADGLPLHLELLLLPLYCRGRARVRLLGVLAPLIVPYWLGTAPIGNLRLRSLRHLGPAIESVAPPRFVGARQPPRSQHGLIVYDGDRPD